MLKDRPRIIREFASVINRNSLERDSNTPDYILAEYLVTCLENWNTTAKDRIEWWDKLSKLRDDAGRI
jgi:hypothetical protein